MFYWTSMLKTTSEIDSKRKHIILFKKLNIGPTGFFSMKGTRDQLIIVLKTVFVCANDAPNHC
jgi:hypothetical protein